jgi:Xaa-Pro aminopeptidase
MFGQRSETILSPGMIATVEPGIYVEGLGGVRIEDDILVTESGYEILTRSSKKLIIIE